jgi:CheY-like chemotaxis protein
MEMTNAGSGTLPRVLVVEDCEDNQFLIGLHLQMNCISFACANNGQEAVERLQNESFDLVLMDMQMPQMNGDEAVRILREQGFQKPVLALTGNVSAAEREHCLQAGFNEHVCKPIDFQRLMQIVKTHLPSPSAASTAVLG